MQNDAGRLDSDLFLLIKKALFKLNLIYFDRSRFGHTVKTNCVAVQIVDPEIRLILIFYAKVWDYHLQHILCMIFQKKNVFVIFY